MAKKGLEYFPMDIDMFQDLKVRKLIKYQGGAAVSVYALLLCIIYKDGYYMRWDKELPFIVSETTGLEENRVSEIIKCCISIGLFDKDLYDREKVLTSRGIQQRYCNIKRLNKRMARIDEYRLIDEPPAPAHRHNGRPDRSRTPEPRPAQTNRKKKLGTVSSQNAGYLAHFFSDDRSDALTKLCASLGFKKPDFDRLHGLADSVIAEWEASETPHNDFSDWSRHLITLMKKRISDGTDRKPTDKQPASPAQPADYSFQGGFGGQDV